MIEGVGVYGSGTEPVKTGKDEVMGKDAFLQLLVTQLQNQDPLNPMENTEFVAQLAQFSSLEGIHNLNSSMNGMAKSVAGLQDFGSAGLIGRVVKADAASFDFDGAAGQVLGYSLGSGAEAARLTVTDPYGLTVRTMELGPQAAGDHEATWDGRGNNGEALPRGTYSFSVAAKGAKGATVAAGTYILGYVTGVSMEKDGASVFVNGTAVKRESIREIY